MAYDINKYPKLEALQQLLRKVKNLFAKKCDVQALETRVNNIGTVLTPAGSKAFSQLPDPTLSNFKYVYNITDDFTTDARFVEGEGKTYSAGTNVYCIQDGNVYKYDVLGSTVDLTPYLRKDELADSTGQSIQTAMSQKAVTAALYEKVDKEQGKELSTNDFSNDEKQKLEGIESNANKYILPDASETVKGGVVLLSDMSGTTVPKENALPNVSAIQAYVADHKVPASDTPPLMDSVASQGQEEAYARGDHTHPRDETKVDKEIGKRLMTDSEADKLASIATGANKYIHPEHTPHTSGLYKTTVDNLGHISEASPVAKSDITALGIPAQDTTYSPVTPQADGLMSAADKTKLDGLSSTPELPLPTNTTLGGVLKNGDKTADETQPVVMDSDGKQWVKQSFLGYHNNDAKTYFNNGWSWAMGTSGTPPIIFVRFGQNDKNTEFLYQKSSIESEAGSYEITNVGYVNRHLAGKLLDAPTAAGQVPKYDGTKVIWENTDYNYAQALPVSGTALTANTIYNIPASSPIAAYQFVAPAAGHIHGRFTTGTPAITFGTGAKFINEAPDFEASTEYEFDVLDNVWVFAKVV